MWERCRVPLPQRQGSGPRRRQRTGQTASRPSEVRLYDAEQNPVVDGFDVVQETTVAQSAPEQEIPDGMRWDDLRLPPVPLRCVSTTPSARLSVVLQAELVPPVILSFFRLATRVPAAAFTRPRVRNSPALMLPSLANRLPPLGGNGFSR